MKNLAKSFRLLEKPSPLPLLQGMLAKHLRRVLEIGAASTCC